MPVGKRYERCEQSSTNCRGTWRRDGQDSCCGRHINDIIRSRQRAVSGEQLSQTTEKALEVMVGPAAKRVGAQRRRRGGQVDSRPCCASNMLPDDEFFVIDGPLDESSPIGCGSGI